jgi:hypothetical protein
MDLAYYPFPPPKKCLLWLYILEAVQEATWEGVENEYLLDLQSGEWVHWLCFVSGYLCDLMWADYYLHYQ